MKRVGLVHSHNSMKLGFWKKGGVDET